MPACRSRRCATRSAAWRSITALLSAERVLRAGISATKFRLLEPAHAQGAAPDEARAADRRSRQRSRAHPQPLVERRSYAHSQSRPSVMTPAARAPCPASTSRCPRAPLVRRSAQREGGSPDHHSLADIEGYIGRSALSPAGKARAVCAVPPARRSRSRDSRRAARPHPPARGRRHRLDRRHRRRRVRDGMARRRPDRLVAAQRRQRHGDVRARRVPGAGAGHRAVAERGADLLAGRGRRADDADRGAAHHRLCSELRPDAGDARQRHRLWRRRQGLRRSSERAARPRRAVRRRPAVRADCLDGVRDRRHESPAVRAADGSALCRRRARRLLRRGADEEEPAGHAGDGDCAGGAPRRARRRAVHRYDDDRRPSSGDAARAPRADDRHGRDVLRSDTLQGVGA